MPSTNLMSQSGGINLVSGAIFSGTPYPVGGIQFFLDKSAPGPCYIGLPSLSGGRVSVTSGGSLSSGGMTDGMIVNPGAGYFISKVRLSSGIETVQIGVPAASSGGVLFWEYF